jgi:hypothetical protein
MINQHQRDRAAMGMHGIGDPGGNQTNPPDSTRGRVSPGIHQHPETHTVVREGVMPNGQPYRVTVNETHFGPHVHHTGLTPNPQSAGMGQLSAGEVQNILRGADAGQATLAMTNAMQRSASGASMANGAPPQPVGVTTPFYPIPMPGSLGGSGRATPDPASRTPSGGSTNALRQASQGTPEVYILQSPQGPRALLMSGTAETYYTPVRMATAQPPLRWASQLRARTHAAEQERTTQAQGLPNPPTQNNQNPVPPEPERQRLAQPAVPRAQGPAAHQVAPILAQLWPHFWLLVRLAAFVWWFTNPNAGWWRWATVIALAIAIFILNTGVLNGFGDQAWVHVRRHMENLIPLADPNRLRNPAPPPARDNPAPAVAAQNQEAQGRNPDPADTAARLVANRRNANANWLMDRVRQVERAGLLFLASIAPGVAERHIENLEAEAERQRREREAAEEAEAERERREAEEAAAAAAEATESATETTENNELGSDAADRGREPPNEEEPLIAL